jgi:hypothetical protein
MTLIEEDIGIELTESYAMNPAASVSGIYFSHPEARTSPWARSAGIRWTGMRGGRKWRWKMRIPAQSGHSF